MKEGRIIIKKKIIPLSIIIIGLLFTKIYFVYGESNSNEVILKNNEAIKLKNFEVPTNYVVNSVTVEYTNLESGIKAIVTDKKSDQIIAIYSEVISEENTELEDTSWKSHLEISYLIRPVTIQVYVEANMIQKQRSAPQIESIPFIYQSESDISGYSIKNPYQSVNNSIDFPSDTAILNLTGQIYSTSEMNKKTDIGYNDFKSSKFIMNSLPKKEWTASKDYNGQLVLRTIR